MNYPEGFKEDMEKTFNLSYIREDDLEGMYDYYWVDQESHVLDWMIEVNKG